MKPYRHVLLPASAVATFLLVFSGATYAGIASTKHNLSTSGTGDIKSTDQQEICVFCHTPHQAIKNDSIPLWNHTLSSTASYGTYTSPTFMFNTTTNLSESDIADVGGTDETNAVVTNLCLSCHDGTIAINSFNNTSNFFPVTTMTDSGTGRLTVDGKLAPTAVTNLGTDLSDDHPVNFTYREDIDPSLKAKTALVNARLYDNKVQCASCHDPHISDQPAFLRTTMVGSALCLECHDK